MYPHISVYRCVYVVHWLESAQVVVPTP